MESFLQSTTAHGLAMLTVPGKCRRLFWASICLASYGMIAWMIVDLYEQFVDPRNQKTDVTVDMVSRFDGNLPKTYPQFVICAKNPKKTNPVGVTRITVGDRDTKETFKLSPLELTFMEDR